jgi:hypothetical protein
VPRASRKGRSQTTLAEAKARQANKISEFRSALVDAGLIALNDQARALGLNRSTAWSILKGTHKASGLSASVVIRMLSAPDLPPLVRSKIIKYVLEKIDGAYGHSIKRSQEFARRLRERLDLGNIIDGMAYPQECDQDSSYRGGIGPTRLGSRSALIQWKNSPAAGRKG